MDQKGQGKKPRNRGAVYPVEILVRLTQEMGDQIEEMIRRDKTQTQVGIIRKALAKYLSKELKKEKPSDE
jgi:Arc/MetJ-type ribon-helix-helix transcriptional regulator